MSGRFVVRPKLAAIFATLPITSPLTIWRPQTDSSMRCTGVRAAREMPHMGSARRFRREALKGLRLWRVPHFEKYLVVYRPRGAE